MKRLVCPAYFLFLFILNAFPQHADFFLGQKKYSFIDYGLNQFHFPDNDTHFQPLYVTLDSMIVSGKGKLQIVHIGGSHIQSDLYTHLIRKRLQTLSAGLNGGRGLIFPYNMARTNNPSNYSVRYSGSWTYCKNTERTRSCNLGLTGIAVTTTNPSVYIAIYPNKDSDIRYSASSVRVFHEPCSYSVSLQTSDSLFTGEYNEAYGYTLIKPDREQDTILLQIDRDSLPDSFTLQGISLDNDAPGIVYNAIGVNGSKLDSYLRCPHFIKHTKAVNPQLVIFSIGTNDAYTRKFNAAKFELEYRQLLDSTLKAVPETKILITVPNDSYLYKRYINNNTAKMRNIIFRLAEDFHCGVWDFYTVMGGLNSSQIWYSLRLMKYDRIHFNRRGYLLKGELFFSAFLKGWEDNLKINENMINN